MNGVSLYRPEFLWGLAFCGAVLAIHLLRRPRVRTLDFSTLRFFSEQAVSATRMRRLRNLLLLLARLLAVAALVVLFAQPFDKKDNLNLLRDPHLTLFTWIDRTPSMEYAEGGVSLLGRAERLVDSLRRGLPATVRHFYYDEERGEFLPLDNAKPPSFGRIRHGPPRLDQVLRAWNENRSRYSQPLLLLLSDYQKSTTDCLDSLLHTPQKSPLACVALTPRAPWNYSLRASAFRDALGAAKVSTTVETQGQRLDSATLGVAMQTFGAGGKKISLRADDSATVDIPVGSALKGSGGSVALAGKDPLLFDNKDFFTAQDRKALRVVVVGDRERNFPISAALSAGGENRWSPVILRGSDEVRFDELDSADAIVVSGISRSSRTLETFLSGRSSAKKIVLIALGADEEGIGANAVLFSGMSRSAANPLKLVRLERPATLLLPDTISELWKGFRSLRTGEAAVYRYAEGLPGTALLRLDNGAPFCTKASDEQGRCWIFFATPLGVTDANNLCETGFFVPCLDRIARYGASMQSVPLDLWIAGFERRNPFYASGHGATVLSEEGKFLERWQSQPSVVFKQPGIYKIVPDGQEAFWVAVRADPAESKLSYSLPSVPEASKGKVMIFNEEQLREALKGKGRFLAYAPWIVLGLLLLAELFLWEKPLRGARPG